MNFEIVISGPGFDDTARALDPGTELTIGSGDTCDIRLNAPSKETIADRQAVLRNTKAATQLIVESAGVTLNGREIGEGTTHLLYDGDLIGIGPWKLRLGPVEALGTEVFEEILKKDFGGTRDKAVMTQAADALHPAPSKPKAPKNPGKTDPSDFLDNEKARPKPAAPKPPPKPQKKSSDAEPPEGPPRIRPAQAPPAPWPAQAPLARPKSDAARLAPSSPDPFSAPSVQKFIRRDRPPRVQQPPPIPEDWDDEIAPRPEAPPVPGEPPKPEKKLAIGRKELSEAFGGSKIMRKVSVRKRGGPDHAVAPRGHALFRVPRLMWTEVAELAELRLAHGDPMTVAMRAALEKTMVGRGHQTDEHPVSRMGSRMQARLFGDDRFFEIAPLSSEAQDVSKGAHAEWDWRVTPLREGHSLLTLRMTMLVDTEGREVTVDAEALHTSVEITVKSFFTRPRRFVRDNWRWMLGGSGIGAAAAIYALIAGD